MTQETPPMDMPMEFEINTEELLLNLRSISEYSDGIFMDSISPTSALTTEADENTRELVWKEENTSEFSNSAMETIPLPDFYPITPLGPPDRGNFPGQFNFSVMVNGVESHKNKYVYSIVLNRMYVNMDYCVSFQFKWDYQEKLCPMFVRAMTVFSDEGQWEKRVERCLQHVHSEKDPQAQSVVKHVLRSAREPGAHGVYYCGEESTPGSFYSVVAMFPSNPDIESQYCSHAYTFKCKNSCSSGINRRSIEVIFTLEDAGGYIYGRQTTGVRVCACPRRDMLKDEDEKKGTAKLKKRPAESPLPKMPSSKKIHLEIVPPSNDQDTSPCTLPPVPISNFNIAETGITVMINMLELQASQADAKELPSIHNSIRELKAWLEQEKANQNKRGTQ